MEPRINLTDPAGMITYQGIIAVDDHYAALNAAGHVIGVVVRSFDGWAWRPINGSSGGIDPNSLDGALREAANAIEAA